MSFASVISPERVPRPKGSLSHLRVFIASSWTATQGKRALDPAPPTMRERRSAISRTNGLYPRDEHLKTIVVFDTRLPGVAKRFDNERARWGELADVEMLDLNHPVLVVRSGIAPKESR